MSYRWFLIARTFLKDKKRNTVDTLKKSADCAMFDVRS